MDILTTPLVNSNPGYSYQQQGQRGLRDRAEPRGGVCTGGAGSGLRRAAHGPADHHSRRRAGSAGRHLHADAVELCAAAGRLPGGVGRQRQPCDERCRCRRQRLLCYATLISASPTQRSARRCRTRSSLRRQTLSVNIRPTTRWATMHFARADAARIGVPRAMLTVDAKTLDILLAKPADGRRPLATAFRRRRFASALRPAATASAAPSWSGALAKSSRRARAPIPALQLHPSMPTNSASFDAPRLVLNGTHLAWVTARPVVSPQFRRQRQSHCAQRRPHFGGGGDPGRLGQALVWKSGSITIEEGASISTVGRGPGQLRFERRLRLHRRWGRSGAVQWLDQLVADVSNRLQAGRPASRSAAASP